MNDDLNAWVRTIRTADDERRARIAGTLSIVAICMLLITNVTVARRGELVAAPQAVASQPSSPQRQSVEAAFTMTSKECGAAMAALMTGGKLIWTDPHTGHDLVAASDVHILSRKQ